jgi:origin of replication binding protein
MTHTITMPISLPISINTQIVDKNVGGDKRAYAHGWKPKTVTLAELAEAIDAGYAFGPQFSDARRCGINFERCGFVAIDSDGTVPLQDALSDPFIQQYGALWYTTASHGKDGLDHFRVIFVLESPIEKGEQYRTVLAALAARFNTDTKIADASRCFFGNRGCAPTILGNILPDVELKALVRQGREADENRRSALLSSPITHASEQVKEGSVRSPDVIPDDLQIRLAHGGTGIIREIPPRAAVHCPFHDDGHPSAFTLRSKSGYPGLHCSACHQTWWAQRPPQAIYDFYHYDAKVRELSAHQAGRLGSNKQAIIINQPFLSDIEPIKGVTLVKSPKGTGKTTALKKLVDNAKATGQSVLLIGHRQVLLRELASRLGLECYLDDTNLGGEYGTPRPDYYAISVDSLPRRLRLPRPYDIVIVDECEQVFRHVTAKTVKDPYAVMTRLQSYIGDAISLYLCDADLNLVTLNFVFSERAKDKSVPVRLILNTYVSENRVCEMYTEQEALIVDLVNSVRAGKRLFVACNSKRRAKLLARVISKELGGAGRVLLITAEEKVNQEVQDFLADIPAKYPLYQAVVASPAIGTGIDITFPGGAQEVDVVYGFFNSGINSHYDVDQQLGRVRNPGEVKVWVCDRQSRFETEVDAIKLDLVQTGDSHPAVKGYSRGVPIIDMNHPLLTLQATAYGADRASQNLMKNYFIRHKELNGWTVKVIVPPETVGAWTLKQRLKRLQKEIDEEFIGGVVNAAEIDEDQWKALFDRRAAGEAIGQLATYEMVRFEVRHFYNDYVTPELVELDDYGRFREAVARYESMHIHSTDQLRLLNNKWAAYSTKERDLSETLGNKPLRSMEAILLASGLLDETGLRGDKIITMADLDGFLAYCDERRITIERDLGVNLREDRAHSPVRTLNLCLDQIGLRLAPLGKSRSGASAVYRYQLDAAGLEFLRKLTFRRRDKMRSTLPEVLQPPRPPVKKKPANDNAENGNDFLDWLKSA